MRWAHRRRRHICGDVCLAQPRQRVDLTLAALSAQQFVSVQDSSDIVSTSPPHSRAHLLLSRQWDAPSREAVVRAAISVTQDVPRRKNLLGLAQHLKVAAPAARVGAYVGENALQRRRSTSVSE